MGSSGNYPLFDRYGGFLFSCGHDLPLLKSLVLPSLIANLFDFPVENYGQEYAVCDLKAYVKKNDTEELVLESVNLVRTEGAEVILRNLFGEEKRVRGQVREVSLVKSRLVVEQV